jgi:2-polyprenyl-3-methyl-5-hydroxy-6-metoxy-1,4-benzoquinol methylase
LERTYYTEYFELEDRHWWFVGRRVILLSLLDRRLARDRELRVLDFGCGTGTMAQHLGRYGSVEAIDADPDAVAFCRQRGLSRVTHLSAGTVPFDDEHFDVVTALDVLEHIEDDSATLTELRRVLRPNGTLLCTVPAFWGSQDEISHHFRRYVRSDLTRRLQGAGFRVLRASYFNTLLFPAIAAIRIGRRALPEAPDLKSDFRIGPRSINTALGRLFAAEAPLIERTDLPFGVSLFALCEPGE